MRCETEFARSARDRALVAIAQGRVYKNWGLTRPKEIGRSTPYKVLGREPLANNLAYYLTGDQKTANQLELFLNVNALSTADTAHEALAVAAGLLTKRALNEDLTDDLLLALLAGRSAKWNAGKNRIAVIRDDWENRRGYEVKFIIR